MRYRGKQNIPRPLYRRFDPYVFTFNLETETVSTFYFSVDLYLSALRGRDDVLMSEYFQYDFE